MAVDRHRERDDGVDVGRAVGLLEPPAAPGVAGDGGVDVRVEVGVVGVDEPSVDDGVVQALAGGDHAAVGLREGDGEDAALLPLLRHLAGPPGVVHGLDDLVLLGELGDVGGDLEHGGVARPGLDADVQVLVDVDDGADG